MSAGRFFRKSSKCFQPPGRSANSYNADGVSGGLERGFLGSRWAWGRFSLPILSSNCFFGVAHCAYPLIVRVWDRRSIVVDFSIFANGVNTHLLHGVIPCRLAGRILVGTAPIC